MDNFYTIISNTCWGGIITKLSKNLYNSVFTGSFVIGDDYIFILKYFNDIDWNNVKLSDNIHSKYHSYPIDNQDSIYPVVLLKVHNKYIEIHYPHYNENCDILNAWNRRLSRMNFDNLLFKFSKSRLATDITLKEFCKLKLPGPKLLITDNIMKYIKYEISDSNFKVIQSTLVDSISVADEPIESLHNLNYKLFNYKFNKKTLLKELNWI